MSIQIISIKRFTVNAVRPGTTSTDMNKDWLADPEAHAEAASISVFSRVGTTEEVADVVAFVASEEARWIKGQFIDATGGSRI